MSEIARVLGELGATRGTDLRLGNADRSLITDALRQYCEHLNIAAMTVRTVKPVGVDRKAAACYLDMVATRAQILASGIDLSPSLTIGNCGEG